MLFSRSALGPVAVELGPIRLGNEQIEAQIEPALRKLRVPFGYVGEVTGVQERRLWEADFDLLRVAADCVKKLMHTYDLTPGQIDLLCYTSVCRQYFEPATACLIGQKLGLESHTRLFDLSNACLGFLEGIIQAAQQIEMGWIHCAIVVACESSRDIIDIAIDRLKLHPQFDVFAKTVATLTGGSGAAAWLVGSRTFLQERGLVSHPLLAAVHQNEVAHAELCRWGVKKPELPTHDPSLRQEFMATDGPGVLKFGLNLGQRAWHRFRDAYPWDHGQPAQVITHQVGGPHRLQMLQQFGLSLNDDFPTVGELGNMGTASIPIGFALARRQGFFSRRASSGATDSKGGPLPGRRSQVGLLGIGSGLTTMMLGCSVDAEAEGQS